MHTITAQSASLLASLETVWGIVFGVLLLGDILTASTFLGRAIILVPMLATYDICSEFAVALATDPA
jgi:drug/metabolite transporter (DMT)-like permease